MGTTGRETLAETLRQAVRDSGRTLSAVAEGAEMPLPVLSRFMRGDRDIRLASADRLAAFFDLELRRRGR
jgi:hypothetical protein